MTQSQENSEEDLNIGLLQINNNLKNQLKVNIKNIYISNSLSVNSYELL